MLQTQDVQRDINDLMRKTKDKTVFAGQCARDYVIVVVWLCMCVGVKICVYGGYAYVRARVCT